MDDDGKQLQSELTGNASMRALCKTVLERRKRVEISSESGDTCVLISKAELDSLEHALEIYAGTSEARELAEKVADLCDLASQPMSDAIPVTVTSQLA